MSTVIYESSISEKLKPFISSLKTLIDEYQQTIVGISQSLPNIENQIDDNVMEARELLDFIFSNVSKKNSSYGVKHEMNQFHIQLNHVLNALKKSEQEDQEIFTKLRESIELSTYAMGKTKDIQNISENLKVFAINSIIYSQKAGIKGKGYQVISGEFIRLSENIAAGTEKINEIGTEMYSQISEFHDRIEKHEEFSRTHLEAISKDSGNLLNQANKSVENFSMILNDLLNRIEKVKEPTYRIMIELQKQDIIHQQLEHLMDAMQDILTVLENPETEGEERNLYTLLDILMVTVEKQIQRISGDLYEMIGGMETLFDNMSSSISDINLDKNQFSLLVTSSDEDDEAAPVSIVDIIFSTPGDMISTINGDIKESTSNKAGITESFSEIEERIHEEKDLAHQFIPVIESINNLLVLAKIEQARYELNMSGRSDTNSEMFSREAYIELEEIVEQIEKAHAEVEANLRESGNLFTRQQEELAGMEEKLQSSLEIISKTKEMFLDNFNLVINITNELFEHVNRHIGLFQGLRTLVGDLKDKLNICSEIQKIVNERLQKIGGPLELEECIFKDIIIQNIVERCTVDNERETLSSEFEDFQIESSTGNNITLF